MMICKKYHILWLDDDFRELLDDNNGEDLSVYSQNANIRDMQSALLEAEEAGFVVDTARNFEEFASSINSGVKYHAIIFDLLGLNPDDPTDGYVMPNAWELVKAKRIATYVCSNTPTLPDFLKRDTRFSKLQDGRIFDKRHKKDLFVRISEDLDNKLNYYNGFEYCLEALSKGYIIGEDEHNAMDNIIKHFSEPELDYCPYNDIRKILENMFRQLLKIGDVKLPPNSKASDIMKAICDVGKNNNGVSIPPEYSFDKCPQEIKNTIQFIWYVSNYYSHSLEKNPNYLQINETVADYNIHIQSASYQAFFVSVKWYVGRRNKVYAKSSNRCGEVLTIEKMDIRYMYSGNYQIQINPNYPSLGVGDKIIVHSRTSNKGPFRNYYLFFVYQDKYSVIGEDEDAN